MINPEALAAKCLRDWLLWKLPASCVTVNLARAAVLRATGPGPYVVPANASITISTAGKNETGTACALTSGTRTATQVAADINATLNVASVDTLDFLCLTGTVPPSYDAALAPTYSAISVAAGLFNGAFGWDLGGESVVTTPITPPGPQGVADGMPIAGFFNPSQLSKGRVLVAIGERTSKLVDNNPRRFEWDVELDVSLFRAEPQQVVHQTREPIQAALQAVRAVLQTDAGKQLGRAANGDVQLILEASTRISPWSFKPVGTDGKPQAGSLLFDAVNLKYLCRVYQAS